MIGYDERRADDLKTGHTQLVLGGVIILAGAGLLVWWIRDRRRAPGVPRPATP